MRSDEVRGVIDRFPILTDRHIVSARQENQETIHQHNETAERIGLYNRVVPPEGLARWTAGAARATPNAPP